MINGFLCIDLDCLLEVAAAICCGSRWCVVVQCVSVLCACFVFAKSVLFHVKHWICVALHATMGGGVAFVTASWLLGILSTKCVY